MRSTVEMYNEHDNRWETVEGRIITETSQGQVLIIHKSLDRPDLWVLVDAISQKRVSRRHKTQKAAIEEGLRMLELNKENYLATARDGCIARYRALRGPKQPRPNPDRTNHATPITVDMILDMAKIYVLTPECFTV